MGKKTKARAKIKSAQAPSQKTESLATSEVLYSIEDLRHCMVAEFAEIRKSVERRCFGTMMFLRVFNKLLLPLRAGLWILGGVFHPVSFARTLRDWHCIRKSRMFDRVYYLRKHPEILALGVDPILHYCIVGWKERRDPRPDFSTEAYLQRNLDVMAAAVNPFYHYVRYRGVEMRREGTGLPMGMVTNKTPAKFGIIELRHVAAPFIEKTLTVEKITEIASLLRNGIYGIK